jgi:TolB-like protein/class 3 adenylate cyclase/Tfp pilus assembly protein PilF
MADGTEQRRLAAIMFTDMVGYTALTQRNEKLALELLEEHRRLLRDLFPKFNGREIETTGDGFLVEFASALEAARCAIEIQRALATRNITVSPERRLHVRIGIHVGDVVHKEGHVLGDGVNIAARLQPLAESGGICVSVDVARQVQHKLEANVVTLGPKALKNVAMPMEVCRIVLPWETGDELNGKPRPTSSIPPMALASLALLAFGLLIWALFQHWQRAQKEAAHAANAPSTALQSGEPSNSVAVLPFVNMSPEKADEYLSDGFTEELLNVLAKVKGLRVPGRSSSFAFKGRNGESIFKQVGEQLHVKTVVEGSVRKAGNTLRISTQLINVADGFHLWSESYDRDMTNIFAIESEVAQRVASALQVQLGVAEAERIVKRSTEDVEAYDLYLKGRFFCDKRDREALDTAIAYFQRAVAKDPKFARGYGAMANVYLVQMSVAPPARATEVIPKAKEAAQRALSIDEETTDAHAALGLMKMDYEWDLPGAEREYRRALEIDSNYTPAHYWYALCLAFMRKGESALAECRRAVEIDPASPIALWHQGFVHYHLRHWDDSIKAYQLALEIDPGASRTHFCLSESYRFKGSAEKAFAELLKVYVSWGPSSEALAQAYRSGGMDGCARLETEWFFANEPAGRVDYLPRFYIQLGETKKALDWLERAYEARPLGLVTIIVDPAFDPLRTEARFQALLQKMGLGN